MARVWGTEEGPRAWAYWEYSVNDCFMPWLSSMVSQRLRPPPERTQRAKRKARDERIFET